MEVTGSLGVMEVEEGSPHSDGQISVTKDRRGRQANKAISR